MNIFSQDGEGRVQQAAQRREPNDRTDGRPEEGAGNQYIDQTVFNEHAIKHYCYIVKS